MKFDKFMEHCFKMLCLATALVVAVGAVVSCTRPLRACAVEITAEEQAGINAFLDTYAENLSGIDFQLNSDSDGNRNVRLQILGRQQLAYNELFGIYDNMDFSVAPSSISVSGSATTGLYSDRSGDVKTLSIMPVATGTIISGDGFSFTIGFSDDNNISRPVSCSSSTSGNRVSFTFSTDYANRVFPNPSASGSINGVQVTVPDRSYWISSEGWLSKWGTLTLAYSFSTSSIPAYNSLSSYGFTYFLSSSPNVVMGYAQEINIPSESVDTLTPWDYYNDYILPDLQEDFPGYDEYFVFPDGYGPEEPPTEPNYQTTNNVYIIPIIIGDPLPVDITDDLGNVLDVLDILADLLPDGGLQIQIDGITLTFPRDGDSVVIDGTKYPLPLPDFQIDGHTINLPDNLHFDFDGIPFTINPDGTITINGDNYTLPIGTPTQLSTDYDNYVYEYEIPTIEKINIVDAEISAPDLADYVDGISFMSGAMSDFIDGIGLMPFIIACLSLGAITYVIWKIGG